MQHVYCCFGHQDSGKWDKTKAADLMWASLHVPTRFCWKRTVISHNRTFISESKQRGTSVSFHNSSSSCPFWGGPWANQSLHACCDGIVQILTSFHFEKESLSTCPHDVPIIIRPSLPAVTGQGLAPRGALLKSPTFLSWFSAHNDGYTEDYIT